LSKKVQAELDGKDENKSKFCYQHQLIDLSNTLPSGVSLITIDYACASITADNGN
jgi:hypothetical protein